jgi:hypothetical protein
MNIATRRRLIRARNNLWPYVIGAVVLYAGLFAAHRYAAIGAKLARAWL